MEWHDLLPGKQARYQGRRRVAPVIDWRSYDVRAVVDTLKLEVTVGKPTQEKYLWSGTMNRPEYRGGCWV